MLPEQTLPSPLAPPALLSPPADLFTRRGKRLRQLASGHTQGPWLSWLAELCAAQQQALDQLTRPGTRALPDQVAAVLAMLAPDAMIMADELSRCIEDNLQLARGETVAAGRDRDDLRVAAAMQVVWTATARRAAAPADNPANAETCPHCGSAAGGSIVFAGDGKAGLRYQECCLCATRWNVVRARCTLCAEGSVVHYLSLEGAHGAVGAETCDACHGYAKIFFQAKDNAVEPLADDLATLALDVLVGEQAYGRGAPNLFLCEGDAA